VWGFINAHDARGPSFGLSQQPLAWGVSTSTDCLARPQEVQFRRGGQATHSLQQSKSKVVLRAHGRGPSCQAVALFQTRTPSRFLALVKTNHMKVSDLSKEASASTLKEVLFRQNRGFGKNICAAPLDCLSSPPKNWRNLTSSSGASWRWTTHEPSPFRRRLPDGGDGLKRWGLRPSPFF